MSYFKVCPHCGAHLDPNETCDCQDKETAPSAVNTEDGKAEKVLEGSDSTSIVH
ncbi:MAG: hypothetical protein HFF26_02950 [Oscillospiraceae bacterium]|nr:hypothetical protein [Oscillospiraceae bacterium]